MNSSTTAAETRVRNFSAGPAVLPLPVLQRVQEELLCLPGAGASVMEISHRSKEFAEILDAATENLTRLLDIPANYKILFLQGGSRLQFSMIPMNLAKGTGQTANYLLTGSWGKKALVEAKREGPVHIAFDAKLSSYNRIPTDDEIELSAEAAYAYYTSNETIEGVQFTTEPNVGMVPLICDASSDFLHRPVPIEKYGVLYACAQKNAGPAGVTVVIIREDLLDRCDDSLPGYCNYKSHVDNNSMFNTPPTFAIYVLNLVLEWLQNDVGGLDSMHAINKEKAALLYDVIDQSDGLYTGHAKPECRSVMNVTFRLPNDEAQAKFLEKAAQRNLHSLKGHRSVGGIRASIYNAMPVEGVRELRDFMVEFKDM